MPLRPNRGLLLGGFLAVFTLVVPAVVACNKDRAPPRTREAALASSSVASGAAKLTAVDCNRLYDEARGEVTAFRRETLSRCERKDDCMLANDTPCLPNAGSATTFAIPKAELASWTAASKAKRGEVSRVARRRLLHDHPSARHDPDGLLARVRESRVHRADEPSSLTEPPLRGQARK